MKKHWPLLVAMPALAWRIVLVFNGEPFWYDEAFSVVVARLPFDRLLLATAGDVHPPFYYLFLKLWLLWTAPAIVESVARSLSLFLSVVALLLYALLLYRLDMPETDRRIAWVLAAWLPGLIYFSAEARMYALLEVLILAAVLCLWYIPGHTGFDVAAHVWAGVFIGMACLTHNVGLIYAPVVLASAALYRLRRGVSAEELWPGALIVTGAAIMVYTPWLPELLGQLAVTRAGYWITPPTLGAVAYHLYMSLLYTVESIQGPDAALMLGAAALTTAGAMLLARRQPEALLLPVGVIGLAFLGSHVAGVGMLLHRLLLPLTFFWLIGWAQVLTRLRAAWLPVCLMFAVANGLYADGRMAADYSLWQTLDVQPGDVIYANNSAAAPLLLYGPDIPIYVAYQNAPMATGLSKKTLMAIGTPMVRMEELDWRRAWFLFFDVPYTTDPERAYKNALIQTFNGELVADLGGDQFTHGELWLLQKSPSGIRRSQP